MSLHSGKRIHGYKWKELPIDEHVIERVEAMAEEQEQPIMHRGMPSFEWAPGVKIDDIIEEENEPVLAIADEGHQNDAGEQVALYIEPEIDEEEAGHDIDENQIGIQNEDELAEQDLHIPNEDEGLIFVPEDNIVSEEESFVENEDGLDSDSDAVLEDASAGDEVVVADIDDVLEQAEPTQ